MRWCAPGASFASRRDRGMDGRGGQLLLGRRRDRTQRRQERDQIGAIRRIGHGNDHVGSRHEGGRGGQKSVEHGGIPVRWERQRLGVAERGQRAGRPPTTPASSGPCPAGGRASCPVA